jgi:hypothetical protein
MALLADGNKLKNQTASKISFKVNNKEFKTKNFVCDLRFSGQ